MTCNHETTLPARVALYALVLLDGLPEGLQRHEERDDIVALIWQLVPDPVQREALAQEVEVVTGTLPDLTDWSDRPWNRTE
jgi:hypothetical protein